MRVDDGHHKVRHAIRDVGAALGMPPAEVDEIAKAFPHIRAKDVRHALPTCPSCVPEGSTTVPRQSFDLVEKLDGCPATSLPTRAVSSRPTLGCWTAPSVEASWLGFPMSQFDKDDVETRLVKLTSSASGWSAMAHAIAEVRRVDGWRSTSTTRPRCRTRTRRPIASSAPPTPWVASDESPGQRELIGKPGPERFADLIIDISPPDPARKSGT